MTSRDHDTDGGTDDRHKARERSFGAGIVDDPYARYAVLRHTGAVHPSTVGELFGVGGGTDRVFYPDAQHFTVLSHDGCLDVLRDHRSFSSHWYRPGLEVNLGPTLLSLDPPEHQRLRSLVQPSFAPRTMSRWERDIVAPTVAHYLDAMAPLGRAELGAAFAAQVPVHVNALALGLPPTDRQRFVEWTLTSTSTVVSADDRHAANVAVVEYLTPLIAERRATPRDDLISLLVEAEVPDDEDPAVERRPLSDEELSAFIRLLIAAGTVTVHRAFLALMVALFRHPEQLAALRADRSLVPAAIEESLRWEQPLAHFGRLSTAEVELAGTTILAGCPVTVAVGAANHDPGVWPDPDRFDIRRAAHPHLSFGFGRHRCLGIHLARVELRVMLEQVLDRLRNLRPVSGAAAEVTGLQIRMVPELLVEWDR